MNIVDFIVGSCFCMSIISITAFVVVYVLKEIIKMIKDEGEIWKK